MKVGFVAMVGLPNAGKSTIVNSLIGEKVGIISRKPQTTRKRVIGVYNDSDSQICFMDSPGRIQAEEGLNAYLQKELISVIRESDACLAVLNVDAWKMEDLLEIVQLVKNSKKPWAIVINKTDLDKTVGQGLRELKLREELKDCGVPIVACSAVQNAERLRGKLLPVVKELLPESDQPLFEDEIYTTQSSKELVAEIVREKCFEYLHQEVPYGLAVKVLKYDESHPTPRIFVDIIVSKDNFVPMVVGKGGLMIKRIGASSRIEAERVLGQKVYLETHVKVKKDWTKNLETMKELGYVITD
ncbi:MAG: GTPase Era [Bdellovibrionales bacterium]|nr:GTPase Era [Bdellovibrionales bacterium]